MQAKVIHDPAAHKFYMPFPEGEAVLNYRQVDEQTLDYYSTYVPPALRGKKIAEQLVKAAFDYAREHRYRIIPGCSYVKLYMDRHPGLLD